MNKAKTNELVSAKVTDVVVPDVDAELTRRADEIARPWGVAEFARDYEEKKAANEAAQAALRDAQAAALEAARELENARVSLVNARAAQ